MDRKPNHRLFFCFFLGNLNILCALYLKGKFQASVSTDLGMALVQFTASVSFTDFV